jgi:hypothetical protein
MKIVFPNPVERSVKRSRTIPQKNTTKRRIDYDDHFTFEFTKDGFYFFFTYYNKDSYKLIYSSHIDDYLDYSEISCEIIDN